MVTNLLVAAFLLFQIIMPASYYLSGGGDDERFSWRMFSAVRLQRCRVQVGELRADSPGVEQPVDLVQDVQVAWINLLKRNRHAVVERYLERRCTGMSREVTEVRLRRDCVKPDGSVLPTQRLSMDCKSGVISSPEAAP